MFKVRLTPHPTWEFRKAKNIEIKEPSATDGSIVGQAVLSGGNWKFKPINRILFNHKSLELITEAIAELNRTEA